MVESHDLIMYCLQQLARAHDERYNQYFVYFPVFNLVIESCGSYSHGRSMCTNKGRV
jgi:hypothetical protein